MSGPSSPNVGGFFGMLSFVLGMPHEELECIGQAIGHVILARQEAGVGSCQLDPYLF